MKVEINEYGDLVVSPEYSTENFAIYHWYRNWGKETRLIIQVPGAMCYDPPLSKIYAIEKETT